MKWALIIITLGCLVGGVLAQNAGIPSASLGGAPTSQPSGQQAGGQQTNEQQPGDLLNQMLKPPGQMPAPLAPMNFPPPANNVTGGAAVAPNATTQPLVREGSFITDRTGRLTKSPDGLSAEFTFDADGQAMQDPPMIILPNLKLELMEQAVANANRDLKFHVTGMVTEYHNRNYLLLERVVVVPDIVQQF